VERRAPFFHGSELSRLLILATLMVVGWALFWKFSQKLPEPAEAPLTVVDNPEPVIPDRSDEFETVTDKTPISFRDNAAYALLLERAREKTPEQLASVSRRDIVLAHLWQNPSLYRGVPIHLLGTARRVLRNQVKLSKTGWLYEAWIIAPDATRVPYVCVFEEAPKGLPIGVDIAERVVFNGYFLKLMKYQAADVSRGAPVLVGRIGWEPSGTNPSEETNTILKWSLGVIGAMFFISLIRWVVQLHRLFNAPKLSPKLPPNEEIDPSTLNAWAQSQANHDDPERWDAEEEILDRDMADPLN
jgi:hypothetical protein